MKLIINNFDKLEQGIQETIQDFIAGYTPDFEVEHNLNLSCDVCGRYKNKIIKKIETYGGVLRVCTNCIDKSNK